MCFAECDPNVPSLDHPVSAEEITEEITALHSVNMVEQTFTVTGRTQESGKLIPTSLKCRSDDWHRLMK